LVIRFTNHAEDKLAGETYRSEISITRELIESVVLAPEFNEALTGDKMRAVAAISRNLSLVVIYRQIGDDSLIITFWPARRGRYES
jgi:hypothetical protein